MKTDREYILGLAVDAMADLLYYDRKEDDMMPVGAIEDVIIRGDITPEEILAVINLEIVRSVAKRKESK